MGRSSDMKTGSTQPIEQRGFGILEVMVAIVILAIALLALGRFQGTLLQTESTSKSRSIAAQLAQAKIDEIRGFTPGSASVGYDAIASLPCSAPETITLSNTTFNRCWGVDTVSGAGPAYKVLTVYVSWTNSDLGKVKLAQQTAIQDSKSELVVGDGSLKKTTGPTVPYTTGSVPEVIPFDIGDKQKKEVSVPEPTIFTQGQTLKNTLVLFDEVVFAQAGEEATTVERDSFATVNCNCELLPSSSTNYVGYTPVIQKVDSFGKLVDVVPSQMVPKRAGKCADCGGSDEQDVTVKELCNICCRDHHDTGTADTDGDNNIDYFDPFRPRNSTLYPSGIDDDHGHFDNLFNAQDDPGDQYLEVCRMKRIDGFWRVMQDWNLVAVKTMPQDTLAVSTATAFVSYINYVQDLIVEYVRKNADRIGTRGYGETQLLPDNSTAFTTNWADEPGLNTTTAIAMSVGDKELFMTRGVYVDYIEDISLFTSSSATDAEVLQQVGWHEVNLKPLANWTSFPTGIVSVTNASLLECTPGEDDTCRGNVTALAAGETDVTATIQRSNSGITNTDAIDSHDADTTNDPARVIVGVGGSGGTQVKISGTITVANGTSGIDGSDVVPYSGSCAAGSGCCEKADVDGNAGNNVYSCTLDANADVVFTISNLNFPQGQTIRDREVCVDEPSQGDAKVTVIQEGGTVDDGGVEITTITYNSTGVALGLTRTMNIYVEDDDNGTYCNTDTNSSKLLQCNQSTVGPDTPSGLIDPTGGCP